MKNVIAVILCFLLLPTPAFAVTTSPFTSDVNTYALYLLDGTAGSAAKVDNAEGTAARDLTQTGSPTASTGQTTPTANGAYTFTNTANQNLQLADPADFTTGALSIEAWINGAAGAPGDNEGVVTKYNGAGDNTFSMERTAESTYFCQFTDSGGAAFSTGTATAGSTAWHYIVCTYEPSVAVRIYVDGSLANSNITSIPASLKNSTAKVMIGNYDQVEGTGLNNFDGQVDSVKISNTTLSATAISNYYNDVGVASGFMSSPWWFLLW